VYAHARVAAENKHGERFLGALPLSDPALAIQQCTRRNRKARYQEAKAPAPLPPPDAALPGAPPLLISLPLATYLHVDWGCSEAIAAGTQVKQSTHGAQKLLRHVVVGHGVMIACGAQLTAAIAVVDAARCCQQMC
jgi:hypothetical protein